MHSSATAPFVSILLCTRNRAKALDQTLEAFGTLSIPSGWQVETIVIDNASSDHTATIVSQRAGALSDLNLRYVFEAQKGKSHALNTGITSARGSVLLFTDDDVRPATDWIERLASPLFRDEADAVGGKILLGSDLGRPWLSESYQRWLAACDCPLTEPPELIGANMGLKRSVLEYVPGFDTDLGPGAAGLGEDTLFGWRVAAAGLRVNFVHDAVVEHRPHPSRLQRASWLAMARSHGRKDAYLLHHWKHGNLPCPGLRAGWLRIKLALRRLIKPPAAMESEGCAKWEMSYVGDIEMCSFYIRERSKPRKYPEQSRFVPRAIAANGT